jgi:hypothetical protein
MNVRLRDDLAEEGMSVPASATFSDYDTQDEPIIYLDEKDLQGATEYDNGVDPDTHPFFVVKLKDGRVFYMVGADLDWGN